MHSETVFNEIVQVLAPSKVTSTRPLVGNPAFSVVFVADGRVPFAQVVVWCESESHVVHAMADANQPNTYVAQVPEGLTHGRKMRLQVEGCRRADIARAQGDDWIKRFVDVDVDAAAPERTRVSRVEPLIRIYFGIHKHMHQPYYRAADMGYLDGEIEGIFATRRGAYAEFIADAVDRYVNGDLSHAGLSTSFSGSLIEQLDRFSNNGLCGGQFSNWSNRLRKAASLRTKLSNPRIDFTAFGIYHPIFPLIPHREIVRSIRLHRSLLRSSLGVEASPVLFPPETAFHVRMIPALLEAGITAVVYDSIHRFRACKEYPYGGMNEGMLPPNRSEQVNSEVSDWMQLQNVWAASKISPSLLRPSWIRYEDVEGHEYRIIGIPAERYLGNEDARGGFGALQYPSVLGQLYDNVASHQSFDHGHPPFFLLHSDGDNYGGGADSYYRHNTEQLVEWLKQDDRFELTTIRDYLDRFPPDPSDVIHVEPGSWSGADNGDPQFSKWFSRVEEPYSPDMNSWSVLTMFQNIVHSVEDAEPEASRLAEAIRLLQIAETSCYWYWTGQDVWDAQVTEAANLACGWLDEIVRTIRDRDRTAPTIFPAWILPANPGGKRWGQGCLVDAPRTATLYTLVADINRVLHVDLILRNASGEQQLRMIDSGRYPSRTGARQTANLYQVVLPEGLGDVRYYLRAVDSRGNVSQSSLERVYLP